MPSIQLFEVGGSIRDEIMGLDSDDRDFCAVSPKGWDSLVSWAHKRMRVFAITPQFFTLRGSIGRDVIDVVMCRKDGASSDGRRPDQVEPGSLLDDLARRDFTCNAMAREVDLNLNPIGDIVDPFGGRADMEESVLASVGKAQDRFREDNLRLMRALRFSITKGLVPDGDLQRMIDNGDNWLSMLETVSTDRIRVEMAKIFKHHPTEGVRALAALPEDALPALFGGPLWLKPTTEKKRRDNR